MLLEKIKWTLSPGKTRESRFACSLPIRCGCTEGHILDISPGGMRVVCRGPIPSGCWLRASLEDGRLLSCRVVWSTPHTDGTMAGLKFDIDEATREIWLRELLFAA
ncbi:MAG: PilZ domain-containing protein [Armatimonadetes bacterium]|nr:PilZ domain-containing protein [Armatimonadota bacterium]